MLGRSFEHRSVSVSEWREKLIEAVAEQTKKPFSNLVLGFHLNNL